jgi:hypothetical protein
VKWHELTESQRRPFERKLAGLYGHDRDESAFDSLVLDKRQALFILKRRFEEIGLWDAVRKIENVYGEGGVGMSFQAWPFLLSSLSRRKDFTTLFANHPGNTGGFLERGRKRASLHFLYIDGECERQWAVHFDLYNPWASPMDAWRHLREEKLRGVTPGWKIIKECFHPRTGIRT